ncbi:hypothetical protein GDO86_017700 [Hymenochirus boettgeri]|uniref:Uncharacterized protein n=1 Tax=Hymenochirus boettgeri TaxID=247094 RepID=A0A8T2IR35_9PIPI|nr:hypothetical protein GDO86_017700 [Hymenochirus boettgeri]
MILVTLLVLGLFADCGRTMKCHSLSKGVKGVQECTPEEIICMTHSIIYKGRTYTAKGCSTPYGCRPRDLGFNETLDCCLTDLCN